MVLAGRQSPLRRGKDTLQWRPFSGGVAAESECEDEDEGSRTAMRAAAGGPTPTRSRRCSPPHGLDANAADGRAGAGHTETMPALQLASEEVENANAAMCHTARAAG